MWNRGLLSPETLSPIDPENPDETKRALLKNPKARQPRNPWLLYQSNFGTCLLLESAK